MKKRMNIKNRPEVIKTFRLYLAEDARHVLQDELVQRKKEAAETAMHLAVLTLVKARANFKRVKPFMITIFKANRRLIRRLARMYTSDKGIQIMRKYARKELIQILTMLGIRGLTQSEILKLVEQKSAKLNRKLTLEEFTRLYAAFAKMRDKEKSTFWKAVFTWFILWLLRFKSAANWAEIMRIILAFFGYIPRITQAMLRDLYLAITCDPASLI